MESNSVGTMNIIKMYIFPKINLNIKQYLRQLPNEVPYGPAQTDLQIHVEESQVLYFQGRSGHEREAKYPTRYQNIYKTIVVWKEGKGDINERISKGYRLVS